MTSLKCPDCGHDFESNPVDNSANVACPRLWPLNGLRPDRQDAHPAVLQSQHARAGSGLGRHTARCLSDPRHPRAFVAEKRHRRPHRADIVARRRFPLSVAARGPDTLGWLSHYRVEKLLGQGGMGMVFQAVDDKLRRTVALKVMRPEMSRDEEFRKRFLREAFAMAALKSDHVVTIYQVGDEAITFLAMEFLQGETLDDLLAKSDKLSIGEVVRIGREMAMGLWSAHEKGLIHRDIKPANIWLEGPIRRVKILDFGLARPSQEQTQLTQPGLIVGTPAYMAPEQADGEVVDHRCDLFSLGCVLYQMCCGQNPFTAGSTLAILKAVALREPKPLRSLNKEVPEALADLIHQMLAKKKEDRPQTSLAVVETLEAIAEDPAVAATLPKPLTGALGRAAAASPHGGGSPGRCLSLWWVCLWSPPFSGCALLVPPKEDIVLGMSAPFEGRSKELGDELQLGIEAYFSRVNEQGGVSGHKLRLKPLDDGYDPNRALENTRKLCEQEKVFGLIGNVGTATAAKTVPYAVENKKLFFGGFSGACILRRDPPDRYVFNYRASYQEETAKTVNYLRRARRIEPKEIAVFAQDDDFGEDGFEGVVRALRDSGVDKENILRVGYDRENPVVAPAAEAILKHPEIKAVIMVAVYNPAARFIHQVKAARPDMIFTNVSFAGSNPLAEALREAGPKDAEGVIVTQVVPLPTSSASGVLQYREDMKRFNSNKKPSFLSLEGYIDAIILVEGLKRAGENPTTESVIKALESIKDQELGIGTKISYSPDNHQGSRKVWGTMIRNGNFEVIEDFE